MSRNASGADASPVSASEAKALFSDWQGVPVLVLAVSGGPDSTALLWLAARWRKGLKRGPRLLAVTVDHGLRFEARNEARAVKRLATALRVEHRTLRWRGVKPRTGLQAAARAARYGLLARAARRAGARHVMTAHSRDDQAETVLMRLSRGSGIGGLAAMARESVLPAISLPSLPDGERSRAKRAGEGKPASRIMLVRPLLDVSKARLIATLKAQGIGFSEDASNDDPRFTRVRWRTLMPSLAAEGLDARALSRLSRRAARAEEALSLAAFGAERALVQETGPDAAQIACGAEAFSKLPAEIRLRLVGRMIERVGGEGAPELGKLEALMEALETALAHGERLKRTLAGAVVSLDKAWIAAQRAPARRDRLQKAPMKALLEAAGQGRRTGEKPLNQAGGRTGKGPQIRRKRR